MLDRTNYGDKVDLNAKRVSARVFEGKLHGFGLAELVPA
jgi:hypothetical protein